MKTVVLVLLFITSVVSYDIINSEVNAHNDVVNIEDESDHLIADNEDQSTNDQTAAQDVLVDFGNTLDHCNAKLSETADIAKYMIEEFMKQYLPYKDESDDTRDVLDLDEDSVLDIKLGQNPIDISDELAAVSSLNPDSDIWNSLRNVFVTVRRACDDLPIELIRSDEEVYFQHGKPARTVLDRIVLSLTRWTEKWTSKVKVSANGFIDSCLETALCERNLIILATIVTKSIEKAKLLHDHDDHEIDFQSIITRPLIFENSDLKEMLDSLVTRNTTEISSFEARFGKLGEVLAILVNDDNESEEEHSHLEEIDEDETSEEQNTGLEDTEMQNMFASAINILRFPWEENLGKTVNVEGMSAVHEIPDTFLSFALESKVILQFESKSTKLSNLMKPLKTAMFRLGGSSANFLTFTPDQTTVDKNVRSERYPVLPRVLNKHPKFQKGYVNESPDESFKKRNSKIHPKFMKNVNYEEDNLLPMDFQPFNMTTTHYENLLDLCSSLNWTLLFDLNQFTRTKDGDWDSSNAQEIIKFAQNKGSNVVWQIGNEPNNYHHRFNFTTTGRAMADDLRILQSILHDESSWWKSITDKMGLSDEVLVVGPDVTRPKNLNTGIDSSLFLQDFLASGNDFIDAVTWHQYYVNSRTTTVEEFTSPDILDLFVKQLKVIKEIRDNMTPSKPIWISETGSAFGGGAYNLSDRFAGSFMWIDKLGVAARDGVSVVARQSLYSGRYALLDEDYNPNPDYWVSIIFKQLVGQKVLDLKMTNTPATLRFYAHCTNSDYGFYQTGSLTIYGVNLANNSEEIQIVTPNSPSNFLLSYVLTADGGDLHSKDVLLNGLPLKASPEGIIPPLEPVPLPEEKITIPPHSVSFFVLQGTHTGVCA